MTIIQAIETNDKIQSRIESVSKISDHCKNVRDGKNGFQRKSKIIETLQSEMISNLQKAIAE